MSARPYSSIHEHLADELAWLDDTLELAVERFTRPTRPVEFEHFGGLILGEREVLEELRTPPGRRLRAEGKAASKLDGHRRMIDERRQATGAVGEHLPLMYLSEILQLAPFEERCLLLALAPELDRKYERVFAYLQDDVTRKLPTVELALALFCDDERERWSALRALGSGTAWRRLGILGVSNPPDGPHPLLSRRFKLDDRIVQFLLGSSDLAEPSCRWATVEWEDEPDLTPELDTMLLGLQELLERHFEQTTPPSLVVHLAGRYGCGREALASGAAAHLGLPTLWIDMRALLGSASFEEDVRAVLREALLQPAAVGVRHFEVLFGPDGQDDLRLGTLIDAIRMYSRLTFLSAVDPWSPIGLFRHERFLSLRCPSPDYATREKLWSSALDGALPEADLVEIVGKFRFTPGQIRDAVSEATLRGQLEGRPRGSFDVSGLHLACRRQASPHLGELARKIDPVFGWDDIVLPEEQIAQLREIAAHVRHAPKVMGGWGFAARFPLGRAVTALFAGGSGTGKTMAAEILAGDLQLDLFKIDLSGVVSKYIGETEKNLNRIFKEAQNSSAILFFDEADALFGKRSEVKDSHDRYANIEIAYLLQRMEEYDGIVILATNLKKNLDEAFVRRMRFIVDFPFPSETDRARIWQGIFPREAPRAADIDVDFLARKLVITGGNIKNIGLRAAYTAARHDAPAIDMGCIIEAAKRELDKVGKLYTEDEFGVHGSVTTVAGAPRLDPLGDGRGAVLQR